MYGMGGPPHMGRGGRFGPGVGNMGPGPRGPRGGMGYEFMLLIYCGFSTSQWYFK